MKAYKILIFIFSVIAMLALACSFFPRGGIQVGKLSLEFPSIEDILVGDEALPEPVDPEVLLEQRLAAIKEARTNDFLNYFRNDPARIYFPGDSIEYFDSFFTALETAMLHPLRIVHYGDSQIEEDRISHVLRNSLQSTFGGGGPGLLPVREKYYSYSISESSTAEPERYMVFGSAEMRSNDNLYGIMGQRFHFDTTVTTSFLPVKSNEGPSRYFNRITLLSSGDAISVSCKGQTMKLEASESVRHVSFELPDSTTRASISYSGRHDVYGIMLDNDKGVSLDNIPMRGCSGTVFTSISSAQLKDYLSGENVQLIILQFGGNSVPYMKTEKNISQYCASIERQIKHLKKQAPDAKILVVGPSDMATNIQGKMQTYKQLPMMVDSLRAAAVHSGAAFWDMYSVMGGEGSMVNWAKSSPPLAGSDYVHFTPKGAEKMGGMLFDALMLYYDYYKLRNNE